MSLTLAFTTLRDANVARCVNGFNQPLEAWNFDDWMVAIGGEVGEALDVVKKLNRDKGGYAGNDNTRPEYIAQLGDELADVVIYLDLFLAAADAAFFIEGEGIASFDNLRWSNAGIVELVSLGDDLSRYGRNMLRAAGNLADPKTPALTSARRLLGLTEALANAAGIDLAFAIVAKFNRTSAKIGYAPRLELSEAA